MTGLSALLAGLLPAGVYRWRPEELVDDARDPDGWSLAELEAGTTTTKPDALAAVGAALRFPGTYGHNLDAVADLLDDLPGPTLLRWDGWVPLATTDPRTFATLLQIFAKRADDPLRPPFVVLLVDDAPAPDDVPGRDLPLLR